MLKLKVLSCSVEAALVRILVWLISLGIRKRGLLEKWSCQRGPYLRVFRVSGFLESRLKVGNARRT